MKNSSITVSKNVAANINKVWEYYTQPEHITQWNFATEDWKCPFASNDLKTGGKYLARMEAKDGSFGFDFEAIYDEVSKPHKLAYTMTDGRKASVTFTESDNQTQVVVTFDADTQHSADMQKDGWQAILNQFKKHVEAI
jgi:uncharacterized protein YndB with AHSA1/START domain